MRVITESEMNFGQFEEDNLFHIEDSSIYRELGTGIKTVEFILRHRENSIVFLEAKKSCPNAVNRHESNEKEEKFEEYYSSITEKFIDSLQIYLATILERFQNQAEVGKKLRTVKSLQNIQMKFILVVKDAKDLTWLAGPQEELKVRLLRIRKIWGIEVAVLNEELAREYGLIA